MGVIEMGGNNFLKKVGSFDGEVTKKRDTHMGCEGNKINKPAVEELDIIDFLFCLFLGLYYI